MTLADALLEAILRDPLDDTPRLVYADWLDENDQPERAEFIRRQCDHRKYGHNHTGFPTAGYVRGCPLCDQKTRQAVILSEHALDWWPGLQAWVKVVAGNTFTKPPRETTPVAVVRRGFVSEVWLTRAAFLGGTCGRCGGDGMAHGADRPFEWSVDPEGRRCPAKCEAGRTTGLAAAIFAEHPVTRVVLTRVEPLALHCDAGSVFNWMPGKPEPESPWFVGRELYDLLPSPVATVGGEAMNAKYNLSHAVAMEALSAACVAYGRRESRKSRQPQA